MFGTRVSDGSISHAKKIVLPEENLNSAAVTILQDLPDSVPGALGPAVRLDIELTMPNGKVETKTVTTRFKGSSDGGTIHFESVSTGAFRIDVNDGKTVIKGIELTGERVKGGELIIDGVYRSIYETDPQNALRSNMGRRVTIKRNFDEEEMEIVGEVVERDGKIQIESPDPVRAGKSVYTDIGDIEDIQSVQRVYSEASWSRSPNRRLRSDEVKLVEEKFIEGGEVSVNYIKGGSSVDLKGEYLGVVVRGHGVDTPSIAVKLSNGDIDYIPLDASTTISTRGGVISDFKLNP